MKILTIDMGKSKSVSCVYQGGGIEPKFRTLPTNPKDFHDLIVETSAEVVVIEIGPLAGWVRDLCQAMGQKLLVANTSDEPWRWRKVKRKTDRDDALKLARLTAANELKIVLVPAKAVRQWRELIGYRQSLVAERTAIKNRIRSVLDRQGLGMPRGKKGWTEAGIEQLRKDAKALNECGAEELWRGMLAVDLDHLQQMEEHLETVDKRLDAIAQADERVKRLRTAPAVGPRMAEAVVAMIDDPKRFRRGRQVGCYAGLTPKRFQSGQMDRQGHISREGSGLLRKLLVQVSWIGIRKEGWMREIYERVRAGSPKRKKLAIVAVARRLLVRLWAMLRDGSSWREENTASLLPKMTALV